MITKLGESEAEGQFLLESLVSQGHTALDQDQTAQPGPVSNYVAPDPLCAERAIQELRERQRRIDLRIAWLMGAFVSVSVGSVVLLKTDLRHHFSGISRYSLQSTGQGLRSGGAINCGLASNFSAQECLARKSDTESTWQSIKKNTNQFSLHE